jgi:hypothetical protein
MDAYRDAVIAARQAHPHHGPKWEMYANAQRPHQGLHGSTPLTIFRRYYPIHAAAMGALT